MKLSVLDKPYISDANACVIGRGGFPRVLCVSGPQISFETDWQNDVLP